MRRASAAPFSPASVQKVVRSLTAHFRIMELCHILFKVRLILGDSEPLICCHNADVFILFVAMALLCVGLPRAHTHTQLISKPGLRLKRGIRAKRCRMLVWTESSEFYNHTPQRGCTAGDAGLAGAL